MACADIGQANADIAGIGIIVAFIFQSLLAFFLSITLDLVLVDPKTDPVLEPPPPNNGIELASREPPNLGNLIELMSKPRLTISKTGKSKVNDAADVVEDFATIFSPTANDRQLSPSKVYFRLQIRKILADILWTASDAQTLAGIALAITGIAQRNSLSLYQFHIIYDTINLTSITNCAAFSAAAAVDMANMYTRLAMTAFFAIIYLVFVVLFGIRLSQWDDNIPGLCYAADYLALPDAPHPLVDKAYLAVTCFYMYGILGAAIDQAVNKARVFGQILNRIPFAHARPPANAPWRPQLVYLLTLLEYRIRNNDILCLALIQLPLHLYFLIRLRITNEPLLQSGGEETTWGFGQIFALVMSVALVVECVKGLFAYRDAKETWDQLQDNTEA